MSNESLSELKCALQQILKHIHIIFKLIVKRGFADADKKETLIEKIIGYESDPVHVPTQLPFSLCTAQNDNLQVYSHILVHEFFILFFPSITLQTCVCRNVSVYCSSL